MSIQLYYRPSFNRSLKHLGSEQKEIAGTILEALDVYYASGCDLLSARKIAPGFFYKQLRKPYCEAGIGTDIRVVIRREEEKGIAVLAGNHNQIKKFLTPLLTGAGWYGI